MDINHNLLKVNCVVKHAPHTKYEKRKTRDLSSSNFMIRDQKIGDDFENKKSDLIEINALKADVKRFNCMGGGHKAHNKIYDKAVNHRKNSHHIGAGPDKMDDVKMKCTNATKKCDQKRVTVDSHVKKRSSRMKSDVIKICNNLFKIEIPNDLAEILTTMNGCVCQYICEKSKIKKMKVLFSYGKSNSQSILIYGNENGMKYALKLLRKLMSKFVVELREKVKSLSFDPATSGK